ncbi:MAG: transporter substrate-binding domain-containing protein [Leptolyngbyaceae cyanobacterium SM1_1_3]|nr:transporter substrate-binding domain-containing protein [Leptolyngbyaceae cyanobacterium SM1_1_3]NJN02472.1 transporter substrate-binding domain-containing protein [Leptolyngbyaceae cyanobacterium RM1_1_2]NJO10181.1 transporter substrate-binding domain-containing protein [Leptolyngbyaceae cyanobacterium SL_1_1]
MFRAVFSFGVAAAVLTGTAAFAAELSEIQARGYLIVGVKDNRPPLGFRDAGGEITGFEAELARRLAEEIFGDPEAVVLEPLTNLERLPAVLDGQVDLAIAAVTITEARSRVVSFSAPYYLDGIGFVTRRPEIQQIEDLQYQAIAVLNGSNAISALRYIVPTAQLVAADSYPQASQLLQQEQAIAFAGDVSVLAGWTQDQPEYRLLSAAISAEPLAAVMPKGTQFNELRRLVNSAIDRWCREGWLDERISYWKLPQTVRLQDSMCLRILP